MYIYIDFQFKYIWFGPGTQVKIDLTMCRVHSVWYLCSYKKKIQKKIHSNLIC